jgi:hypothetical protein
MQYFSVVLGEPYEGRYEEEEEKKSDDDAQRMHRDLPADPAEQIIRKRFGKR